MQQPTRIWLMRHAETALPTVFHGAESDIGLSEHGLRQAHAAAESFVHVRPAVVVSSAMLRARTTAEPIAAAAGCPHRIEPDLHERRVGILSGLPTVPEPPPWVETLQRWMAGETSFATPGAESFDQIRDRTRPILERLAREYSGKSIVVVAHGIVCKVLLLSLLPGYSPADWKKIGRITNLATSILRRDGTAWHAETLNVLPVAVAKLTA